MIYLFMRISHHHCEGPLTPTCEPARGPWCLQLSFRQKPYQSSTTALLSKHVFKSMISDEICPPDSSLLVNMFSHLRHFTLLPSSLDANTSASFSAERRLIRHRPAITRYLPGSMAAVSYQQMSDCVGIIVRPGEKHTLLSSKLGVPHLPLSIPITAARQPPSCTVSIVIGLIQA